MNFQEALERAKSLSPKRISNDLFKFVRKLENELAQYNRANLYIDSEDAKGKPIGFYSRGTEILTEGRKKEGQPFNLFETGDFLGSLFARVENESIFFGATDKKKEKVLGHLLSKDIFGLQDEDLKKVINDELMPFFLDYFRTELF